MTAQSTVSDRFQEHFNPLVCFSTYSQDEQIHVAAWPPVKAYDGGLLPYSMSSEGMWTQDLAFSQLKDFD
jgi:hypothetical protein